MSKDSIFPSTLKRDNNNTNNNNKNVIGIKIVSSLKKVDEEAIFRFKPHTQKIHY